MSNAPGWGVLEESSLHVLSRLHLVITGVLVLSLLAADRSQAQSFLSCSDSQTQELSQARQLKNEAGMIINAIFQKLGDTSQTQPAWVSLVQSAQLQAFSLPNGEILISTGLLQHSTNNAELAFIVSHEIAHKFFEHPVSHAALLGEAGDQALSREIEADNRANQLMQLLNLPRGAGQAFLSRIYDKLNPSAPEIGSALKQRIKALDRLG